jgi:hypothetical protein
MKRTTQRNFKLNNEDIETVRDQKAEKGHMIAAAINAAIVAHDADKRADAEAPKEEKKEEAKADESGEMLNKILVALDSLGKRMDGFESSMMDRAKKDAEEKEIKNPGEPEDMKCDSDEDLNRRSVIQNDADKCFASFGDNAPRPWDRESPGSYLRRCATKLKHHSPAWKEVDLGHLNEKELAIAAKQIFADSSAVATSNEYDPSGTGLREVRRVNRDTGHVIKEYYGDPLSWMSRFAGGRRLAKFNLKAGDGTR